MKRLLALFFASCCLFWTGLSFADDAATRLAGTWKVVSLITRFDGGDAVEPFGPNPKGRLVLTPEGQWIIILTGANREPAKNLEEKAALLDSMLAYSGKYTIEGNRMTIRVDMSWNEIYSGANQNQTRFFTIEGDKLIIRSPEIVSAVRPGQKAVATLTVERER
jgi:lipocalin-like protein